MGRFKVKVLNPTRIAELSRLHNSKATKLTASLAQPLPFIIYASQRKPELVQEAVCIQTRRDMAVRAISVIGWSSRVAEMTSAFIWSKSPAAYSKFWNV
jgi:hypothetical protein